MQHENWSLGWKQERHMMQVHRKTTGIFNIKNWSLGWKQERHMMQVHRKTTGIFNMKNWSWGWKQERHMMQVHRKTTGIFNMTPVGFMKNNCKTTLYLPPERKYWEAIKHLHQADDRIWISSKRWPVVETIAKDSIIPFYDSLPFTPHSRPITFFW